MYKNSSVAYIILSVASEFGPLLNYARKASFDISASLVIVELECR